MGIWLDEPRTTEKSTKQENTTGTSQQCMIGMTDECMMYLVHLGHLGEIQVFQSVLHFFIAYSDQSIMFIICHL
jgi:hypothetical protein